MADAVTDYRPMWEGLGLDLGAHDLLLFAIPMMYADAYLSQTDRPEGMAYFDFVLSEIHGLRIKELMDHKAAGGTVALSVCTSPKRSSGRSGASQWGCAQAPSGRTTR